jgi:hypothetical protein
MNKKLAISGVLGLVLCGLPCCAIGQDIMYGSPGFPSYWGYPYWNTYAGEHVPYFALNPPVYYSYRVARTYGYSPFAYLPGVLTPGSESPRPVIVHNPYVPRDEEGASETSGRTPPLRIDNPFVEQAGKTTAVNGSRPGAIHPKVVYPASLAQRAK